MSDFGQSLKRVIELYDYYTKTGVDLEKLGQPYLDLCRCSAELNLPRPPIGPEFWVWLSEAEGAITAMVKAQAPTESKPIDYAEFKDANGEWMTAQHCEERYEVLNPRLCKLASKDPSVRVPHPDGRGFVYKRVVVERLADDAQVKDPTPDQVEKEKKEIKKEKGHLTTGK